MENTRTAKPVNAEELLELVRNHDLMPLAYRRVDDTRFIVAVRLERDAGIYLVDAAADTCGAVLETIPLRGRPFSLTVLGSEVDTIGDALGRHAEAARIAARKSGQA